MRGVEVAAVAHVADDAEGMGDLRHLERVLGEVLGAGAAHERPALDVAHPGQHGEEVRVARVRGTGARGPLACDTCAHGPLACGTCAHGLLACGPPVCKTLCHRLPPTIYICVRRHRPWHLSPPMT